MTKKTTKTKEEKAVDEKAAKTKLAEEMLTLKPMSRLDFQILYGKCASSGWVHSEFNETLYQQYLQRYGFFLCHILFLKTGKISEVDGLITYLKENSDIFFLVDKDNLIHTISLRGTFEFYHAERNFKPLSVINWFFAESPNTIETYVYNTNENKKSSPYFTGPKKIINDKKDWLENMIVLLDFFPFPIIMSTDIRKDVVKEGYTFRVHLSEYFKPLFKNVKKILEPDKEKTKTKVHLISPPYTSIHAIFELTDFEWAELVKLNDTSTYKQSSVKGSCGFDAEKTPEKIFDGFIKIRKNEFEEFSQKFYTETQNCPDIYIEISLPATNYIDFCAYLKKRIYLNNSNNPGTQGKVKPKK